MCITVFLFIHTNELTKTYDAFRVKQQSTIISSSSGSTDGHQSGPMSPVMSATDVKYGKKFLRSLQSTEQVSQFKFSNYFIGLRNNFLCAHVFGAKYAVVQDDSCMKEIIIKWVPFKTKF